MTKSNCLSRGSSNGTMLTLSRVAGLSGVNGVEDPIEIREEGEDPGYVREEERNKFIIDESASLIGARRGGNSGVDFAISGNLRGGAAKGLK